MTSEEFIAGTEIQTDRLRLLPLSVESLQLYLEDVDELERRLGFPVSRSILTERVHRAVRMKIDRMRAAAVQDHVWYTYWLIVVVQQSFGAGLVGFKGIDAGKADVEIGYGIDPACQKRGYMTESVDAMVNWAFQDQTCQRVTALKTLKENAASLRVLEKAGFRIFAVREDSYDLYIDKRWKAEARQQY